MCFSIGIWEEADSISKQNKKGGKKTREEHIRSLLYLASMLSLILAVVFSVLLALSFNDHVQQWYQTYIKYLLEAEHSVEAMDDKFNILIVIIFLYVFKSVFPIQFYPLSVLCAITSTVFPAYLSLPINIFGLFAFFSIRYYWGRRVGSDAVQSILKRNVTIRTLIENDGRGNPWLLAVFRLIPSIPPNPVSKLYGAMGFEYKKYILLSLIGFAPQLITYTFIGSNVFNPLSAAFLVPFILLFVLISISTFAISKILKIQYRRKHSNG